MFGLVLGVLIQSSNKEFFIERILRLPTEHQAYFAEVIQRTMGESEELRNDRGHERMLLEQLDALEEENCRLRIEMGKSVDQQTRMEQEITELEGKLQAAHFELETIKNGREGSSII